MIGFFRRLFGKKKESGQMDAMCSVMDRYPNTLKSLAESEAKDRENQ